MTELAGQNKLDITVSTNMQKDYTNFNTETRSEKSADQFNQFSVILTEISSKQHNVFNQQLYQILSQKTKQNINNVYDTKLKQYRIEYYPNNKTFNTTESIYQEQDHRTCRGYLNRKTYPRI